MIINMGPQHPSTHGVLRLMLELQGETVLRCKPIIGYLHTGMEKTGETSPTCRAARTSPAWTTPAPLFNELVFSHGRREAARHRGDIPERATWIRMLLCELNRMSVHLLFLATNGMDLGAVSMMIYGWREREEVLRFFQKVTGPADEPQLHPPRRRRRRPARRLARRRAATCSTLIPPRLDEYDMLITGQPIWRERLQGVGVDHRRRRRIALGATGPILRSTGVPWDLRRDMPYLHYDQVEFDVDRRHATATASTATRSGSTRSASRCAIVRQILDRMPRGRLPHPGQEGHAAAARPHRRVDGGADPPLQDLHRGLQGARGRGLRRHREPARRARLLHRVSDGSAKPYRMHIRGPCSSTSSRCRT